jgi:hypothetical protein
MKRAVGGVVATVFAMQLLLGGAWAGTCANQADASALRVAALQQELMVAAFTCHDVSRYNNFVRAHQPELIASDDALKSYFVKRSGEAAYHTYKTELANSASLRSLRDDGFCAHAEREFDVSSDRASLSDFVGARRFAAADVYPVCEGVILRTADASDGDGTAPRLHHHRHRLDRDDSYAGRGGDDGYRSDRDRYADRDGSYSRGDDDRDSDAFDAPAPHRHLEDYDR